MLSLSRCICEEARQLFWKCDLPQTRTKAAILLVTCIQGKQRAVMGSESDKPADIHYKLKIKYRDTCVFVQKVYE